MRRRVLVVDDNPWMRETLTVLLSDAGYVVLTANDGVEALDVLRSTSDRLVVVLDLVMPRLSGFGVLTHLAIDTQLATRHGYIVCSAKAPSAANIGLHFVALLQRLNTPFVARSFDIDVLLGAINDVTRRLQREEATDDQTKGTA